MNKRHFFSYKNKLIFSYLLLICIPLIILGSYSFMTSKKALNDQIVREYESRLADTKHLLNLKFKEYIEIANIIKFDDNILTILENEYKEITNLRRDLVSYLDPLFKRTLLLKPGLTDIKIYTDSTVPQFDNYIVKLEAMKNLEWLDMNRDEGWYAHNEEIYFVQKFFNYQALKDNNFLVMTIDNNDLVGTLNAKKNNKFLILNEDNEVIYNSLDIEDDSLINNIVKGSDDADKIILEDEIELVGWRIFAIISKQDNNAELLNIVKITMTIIITCLCILFLVAIHLSNTLFRPIKDLSKVMKRVGNGDFEVKLTSKSNDEIGSMTYEFNKMVSKINELIEQVYKANIIKKEAQLRALQAQINPHFLYNTLSMINWKAILNNQKEISECVNLLSKFYETALNKGKSVISVYDEIENMKAYIDIQLIMHSHAYSIEYDIDENVYEYYTLNLLLQPFVENAIEHGLRKLENIDEGILIFKAYIENQSIIFVIDDNGIGIKQDAFDNIFEEQSKHYGIKNVQERIQLQFGDKYGLKIINKVVEDSRGVRVILTLPLYKVNERTITSQ